MAFLGIRNKKQEANHRQERDRKTEGTKQVREIEEIEIEKKRMKSRRNANGIEIKHQEE
jgi:hypothetical protein